MGSKIPFTDNGESLVKQAVEKDFNIKNVKVTFDGKEIKGMPYAPIYVVSGEEVDRATYIEKLKKDYPGITDDELRTLLPLEE